MTSILTNGFVTSGKPGRAHVDSEGSWMSEAAATFFGKERVLLEPAEDVVERVGPVADTKSCVAGTDFALLLLVCAAEDVMERIELEAVREAELTFHVPLPPSSSKGRKKKNKKAKLAVEDEAALEEHSASCESERVIEQVSSRGSSMRCLRRFCLSSRCALLSARRRTERVFLLMAPSKWGAPRVAEPIAHELLGGLTFASTSSVDREAKKVHGGGEEASRYCVVKQINQINQINESMNQ